ncbi:MAG: hypothetical protein GXP31_00060 [Kiritimatiellaeota bacterium]|nr:hypothetical protein [Kiritimatiellota bacterium]
MKHLFAALVLGTLAAVQPAIAEVNVAATIPKEMVIVGRLDLATALKSPVVNDVLNAFGDKYSAICNFCQQAVGFDLEQVRTVWFMSAKPDTSVIVFSGPFVAEDIRRTFGVAPNVTVIDEEGCLFAARFRDDKTGQMKIGAILDEGTLAFGDEQWMNLFLETWRGRHPAHPTDSPQVQRLTQTKKTIAVTLLGGPRRWPEFDRKIARLLEEIWISVDISDTVNVQFASLTKDPQIAQGAAMIFEGLTKVATARNSGLPLPPLVRTLLQGARFGVDGKAVMAAAAVTQESIQQLLAARR